jgi:hypothetical protein
MRKDQTVSFYEQYLREYRSVVQMLVQTLANRHADPECDELSRLRLLHEEMVATFIHLTERMQDTVRRGQMEVDVVLAALVRECCDRLATLEQRCELRGEHQENAELRRQNLVRPADNLFQFACTRMLKGT